MGGRRNVRLKKGFANVEKAPFGGEKLRIPTLLYVEKMRTQSRFNVRIAGIYDDACLLLFVFSGRTRMDSGDCLSMRARSPVFDWWYSRTRIDVY